MIIVILTVKYGQLCYVSYVGGDSILFDGITSWRFCLKYVRIYDRFYFCYHFSVIFYNTQIIDDGKDDFCLRGKCHLLDPFMRTPNLFDNSISVLLVSLKCFLVDMLLFATRPTLVPYCYLNYEYPFEPEVVYIFSVFCEKNFI